ITLSLLLIALATTFVHADDTVNSIPAAKSAVETYDKAIATEQEQFDKQLEGLVSRYKRSMEQHHKRLQFALEKAVEAETRAGKVETAAALKSYIASIPIPEPVV